MKIIYNNILPLPGYAAIMLFGVIFARKKYGALSGRTINHERIHQAQAKECGGYFIYYFKYLLQWIKYGYKNMPFEEEAYTHAGDTYYIENRRKPFAWKAFK